MPHSEVDNISSNTTSKMAHQVNGDVPSSSSAFLSHLISYPFISDSIQTFKSNPYGAKSLTITNDTYQKLGKPLLPYLSKPYQYVSPYVARADSIGDSTLSTLDERFPAVKKPTGEFVDSTRGLLSLPLKKGTEGKEYVFGVYEGEVKKVGGQEGQKNGVFVYGKAAVATGLIVGNEVFGWLGQFLQQKKAEAKEVTNEKLQQAQ